MSSIVAKYQAFTLDTLDKAMASAQIKEVSPSQSFVKESISSNLLLQPR